MEGYRDEEVKKIKEREEWEKLMARKYNLTIYFRAGETVRCYYYVGISLYNGEKRLVILQMSKYTGYITGMFSVPFEISEDLIRAIKALVNIDRNINIYN